MIYIVINIINQVIARIVKLYHLKLNMLFRAQMISRVVVSQYMRRNIFYVGRNLLYYGRPQIEGQLPHRVIQVGIVFHGPNNLLGPRSPAFGYRHDNGIVLLKLIEQKNKKYYLQSSNCSHAVYEFSFIDYFTGMIHGLINIHGQISCL